MLCNKSPTGPRSARPAFTLMELIVVIAILAALAALTAGAVVRVRTVQQQNNTRATLNKVQAVLNSVVAEKVSRWQRDPIPGDSQAYILKNLAGVTDANAMARMRVIYVKLKLQQLFPETFVEAYTMQFPAAFGLLPDDLKPVPTYTNYLYYDHGLTINTPGQYQSAVCLLMVLRMGGNTAGFSVEDMARGGALATVPVDPAPGSPSAPMLVDAWGTPICFSRFASGCPTTNPNGPQAGANDRLDPNGSLNNSAWTVDYQQNFSQLLLQDLAPGGMSYNYWPVLASAGPDKQFGLSMYNFVTTTPAQSADNLYSTP